MEGIVFPRVNPRTGHPVGYRIEGTITIRNDKPEGEYLSSPDKAFPFFPPDCIGRLNDLQTPIVFVEAEKSTLCIEAAVRRQGRSLLPIGLGGCFGWSGRTGKVTAPDGATVDEKGLLSAIDAMPLQGRPCVILFDANVATNPKVQAAERALSAELRKRGAAVKVGRVPVEPEIDGPDDYRARYDDTALLRLIDGARGPGTGQGGMCP